MKPFPLKHVVLYAKGHYSKSSDIWMDLASCTVKLLFVLSVLFYLGIIVLCIYLMIVFKYSRI